MSEGLPNTFNDPGYERRLLLTRLSGGVAEILVARTAGQEAALRLARDGRVIVRPEGGFLVVRRAPHAPPDRVA